MGRGFFSALIKIIPISLSPYLPTSEPIKFWPDARNSPASWEGLGVGSHLPISPSLAIYLFTLFILLTY